MKSTLNSKEYVTFARRFVKETVDTMDIEELKGIVTDRIHEEIQEGENTYGQEGAFEEMIAWSEDVFLSVAKDFGIRVGGSIMEKLTFNNEQLEFLKFIVQDFEYNDDHERYMIEQIENKIYQAQENQMLKVIGGLTK